MIGKYKKAVMIIISSIIVALEIYLGYSLLTVGYELLTSSHEWVAPRTSTEPTQRYDRVLTTTKETAKTSYEYVPKASPRDSDVEVTTTPKPLVVSVNGVVHKVTNDTIKEEHKLDKGKLVVTEDRQVTLDLKVPEPPRFKKGVFIETDENRNIASGLRLSYQTEPFDIDLKADLYNKKHDNRILITGTKWL